MSFFWKKSFDMLHTKVSGRKEQIGPFFMLSMVERNGLMLLSKKSTKNLWSVLW